MLSIVRVIYLKSALQSSDPTLAGVDAAVLTEVLLHYSIMAATIPCLKSFIISFNTGWLKGEYGDHYQLSGWTIPGTADSSTASRTRPELAMSGGRLVRLNESCVNGTADDSLT
jgi:hypothetical protein